MKKILVLIATLLLAVSVGSAKELKDTGNHSFTFHISSLAKQRFKDKIIIQNNSSYKLKGVKLRIWIDGKSHTLRAIDDIDMGDDENFRGTEDDDMKDELKYHFGEAGKLIESNQRKIRFDLVFGNDNEKVIVSDYVVGSHDLIFTVEDNLDFVVTQQVVEDEVKVYIIDGKKWAILNGCLIEMK